MAILKITFYLLRSFGKTLVYIGKIKTGPA